MAATDLDKHEEERLFEYPLAQHQFSTGQFATSLIGLGALFFAYGSVSSPFLRLIIASVAIGASFVLWFHTFGARYESWAIEEEVGATGLRLMNRYKRLRSWRKVGWLGDLYQPVLRLTV